MRKSTICLALIPFASAPLTLSLVMPPMTIFGRNTKLPVSTNKLSILTCSAVVVYATMLKFVCTIIAR